MKNPTRISAVMPASEMLRSQYGLVTCAEWCAHEVNRMAMRGVVARVAGSGAKVWIVRPRAGLREVADDES